LDAEVERFRTRRLEGPYPYVRLDATFVKVRSDRRVVSMAVVIAIRVRASGEREVLGLALWVPLRKFFWPHYVGVDILIRPNMLYCSKFSQRNQ
jgi:transposase-like protein